MPKFQIGSPQVTFLRKDGRKFTKTYHSRKSAADSVRAYRRKGGRVVGTGFYDKSFDYENMFRSKLDRRNFSKFYL